MSDFEQSEQLNKARAQLDAERAKLAAARERRVRLAAELQAMGSRPAQAQDPIRKLDRQLEEARAAEDAAHFDHGRAQLKVTRVELAEAQADLGAARERRARLEAALAAATRVKPARGEDPTPALREDLEKARAAENTARAGAKRVKADAIEHAGAFGALADPRKVLSALDDAYPILLMPVRLETRFKRFDLGNGTRDELWVRIYPDDCAVDTFEATLSDNEIRSGQRYWTESWAGGGFEGQERAAWRNLVASHGVGRAAWIIREFRPVKPDDKPSKVTSDDIILVIVTDAPPAGAEKASLADYWKAVWLADGDKPKTDAAATALGVSASLSLAQRYVPANLNVSPLPPKKRGDVAVSVAWLELPSPAALAPKTRSWTAPPRVRVLPDRFVVIGYQGGKVVFQAIGAPIPSPLVAGPDPSAPAEEQFKHDANGDLMVSDDMRWMVDFDTAVSVGMGIKVPLNPATVDLAAPIDRLLAIGVRLADDAHGGRAALEELLAHHRYGRAGFSFVPQGTPTNNTDSAGAGYSRVDDADAAYDALARTDAQLVLTSDWWQRPDGQWLADSLGIDPAIFDRVPHANGKDLAEARAMNRALWPATFGYAMETMLHPVFTPEQIEATRWFFTRFVSGRGFLPCLRIGDQPYGVLPVTALSRLDWLTSDRLGKIAGLDAPRGFRAYLQGLAGVLGAMRADWDTMAQGSAFVGKSGDPHQILLDVLGLHPTSVEYHQRYAESLQHLFNHAKLQGLGAPLTAGAIEHNLRVAGLDLLRRLGYAGKEEPDILDRFFFGRANRLNGPLIDDRPLSESDAIRAYTDDGRNYVRWLLDAARHSLEDLRLETGYKDDKAPDALLYLLLRHALMLGYWNTSLQLHLAAGTVTFATASQARREPPFIHVSDGDSESRLAYLHRIDARITDRDGITVAEHITQKLGQIPATRDLDDQLAALDLLKDAPTARLERSLAEHIDTASYRLDAWLLGLVNYQLAVMRYRDDATQARRGIYLGAYGWLESLQRKQDNLTPVNLRDDLALTFLPKGAPPLLEDPANGGHVLAPSLSHAVTAAVLRAGYLANATPEAPQALAVNLSSERVRVALGLIEGIRNGQPLGALLGYRLHRGLHDRHGALELDPFIDPLRRQFPLVANQMTSTKEPGASIETIEARNVVDGLKMVEHIRKTGNRTYPFGLPLPPATAQAAAAITEEVDRLLDAYDALADLTVAEGVHQAVLGNYDRVASTLDAYSKGTFPPEPEVVRTPRSGFTLTHRVGLHFEAGVAPEVSAIAGFGVSPRSQAQPAVNKWLARVLPPPDAVACLVEWLDPVGNALQHEIVTQEVLKLQPIDLVYIGTPDGEAGMTELDDRILSYVITARKPRSDAVLTIRHTQRLPGKVTFFELAPLVRSLRSVLLRSRPLMPTDVALSGEAEQKHDATQSIARDRVLLVREAMTTLQTDAGNFAAVAPVDTAIDNLVVLFERAARFGIQQIGWGFVYEWRHRTFSKLLARVTAVVERWTDRVDRFDEGLADYDALPAATADDERFPLLGQLDLLVAATPVSPRPATPADYRAALAARRTAMATKRDRLQAILTTPDPRLAQLIAAIEAELPLDAFDVTPFAIADVEKDVTLFLNDLRARMDALKTEIAARLKAADERLAAHDAAAEPATRVDALQKAGSALLGEDLRLIPEFTFAPVQGAEVTNALAASKSGELTRHLTDDLGIDYPVDDWLHGVARVRDKMRHWEQITMLTATLGQAELSLTPIQLPHRPDESWLALEFKTAQPLDGERLLYTAHYAVEPNAAAPTCGLLLDEWTEVVPSREETAGLAFHYDGPGSEPPQAWLLVTPARADGKWQWDVVVDAVNETLELARLRAVEPGQIDDQAYARFLPATMSAVTLYGVSIAANFSRVNNVAGHLERGGNG